MSRHAVQSSSAESPGRSVPVLHPLCAALAVAFTLAVGTAWAQLPSGAQVVNGSASIVTNGSALTISNSPNAILDWRSFSIGSSNSVHFQQESAASQVLNRVVGQDASHLFGSLSSNGRVWLVNPHGVLFGPGARVDVAGLVASTLGISNGDFLSARNAFVASADRTGAQLLNQGQITTTTGGRVWLIGDSVRNEGLIQTPGGQIVLAAGKSIELIDSGAPNLALRLTAPDNEVLNLGQLIASGSSASIDLHGGIVNQQGIVRADSVGADAAGRVVLRAQGNIELGDGSQTSARAAGSGAGGQVIVDSNAGTTLVSGQVMATSLQGQGGRAQLLGDRVGIYHQASVDVSGASGGGTVLVGGDYQGNNPLVRNAQSTYVGPDVKLRADAIAQGDGGQVIAWSDRATRVYGSLSARAGPEGGDGGLIETSGSYLDARPAAIDATAAKGRPGTWLLDPNDIVIAPHDGVNSRIDDSRPPDLTSTDDSAIVDTLYLVRAIGQGQRVVIRTGSAGDITVAGNVNVDYSQWCESVACAQGSLTLQAQRNITINPDVQIRSHNGAMPLSLQADSDGNQDGGILIGRGALLDSGGGNIVLHGPGVQGIRVDGATIDSGDAVLSLTGSGTVFELGTVLSSSASGDAIVVRSGSFDNLAGAGALNAPNGRWLVHTDGASLTQMGGLPYDFVQFNASQSTSPGQESGNGLLHAESLDLQGRISRVYDGTVNAALDASTVISGAPVGYQVGILQPGAGSFPDKHVGIDKPITLATEPVPVLSVMDVAGKPVYGHSTHYTGDITPAQLSISAKAQDKVYDGGRSVTLTDLSRTGVVAGDSVNVSATGSFGDANAGAFKLVGVNWSLNGGDAGNYTLNPPAGLNASIIPAPLNFVADPALGFVRRSLPALSGTVSGFVAEESWPASWSTTAQSSSSPGSYPVYGMVASGNYHAIQAESNGTALTLVDGGPASPPEEAARAAEAAEAAMAGMFPLLIPPSGSVTVGLVDLSSLSQGKLFGPVNVHAMSSSDLAGLLASRHEFKRQLFADSIDKLEIDPSLADVKSCVSAEEAGSGLCRITPEIIADVQAKATQAQPVDQAAGPQHQPALPLIQRKIAVLFGSNDYGDRRIPRLESAIPDVEAVSKVLNERLGYEVRLLRNSGKADIIRTLNQVALEARPADSVLIYYAGHGYSLEKHGAGYWIPADAPVDDPTRWLSNADISRLLAGYQPRQTALISDSCYSGAFAREALDGLGPQVNAQAVLSKRSVVVLSSGGDEPVTDEGKEGHSIFAWNFMQSVNSVQGWTPGNSIFRQVQTAVKKEFPQTPQYGAVTAAGHQRGGEYLFEVR